MKKYKRILAFAGVILLVCMYLSTLIFAFLKSPYSADLLKASIACTIIVPVLLYGYILVYRLIGRNKNQEKDSTDNKKS